jgi:signal transduction histidine kinase
VTLRAKLSVFLSVLLALSIGLTGGILIVQSARAGRRNVTTQQQLFAENRAFALRDNLQILEAELGRLALLPEVDMSDQNPEPEERLLEQAHAHSILYNTAVLLLDEQGDCVGAVPAHGQYEHRRFGTEPWFSVAKARGGVPSFAVSDLVGGGRAVTVVQPIVRKKQFTGALVGVIALDDANVITSAIVAGLPPETEPMLIDAEGTVLFPTDWPREHPPAGWQKAIVAARLGPAGTLNAEEGGEASLFSYAPVDTLSGYRVLFRRPWAPLMGDVRHQVVTLVLVLVLGILVACGAALLLSARITRPLTMLRERAARIARGQEGKSSLVPRPASSDELGALANEFLQMEEAIAQRDKELRDAALSLEARVRERTRELEAAQQALLDAERFAAMGKTSAAIAHELRNALNGLGMAVELILEDPGNKARLERLRTQVLSEIGRLRDVVDSLLSFSRSPRIEASSEDLGEVVRRAVAMVGDLAAERGADVVVEVPERLMVRCDGHKIQGVVMNLVKNAAEAARSVRVRAFADGDRARVEVADDGPGFSADAQRHVFEPFFTTKRTGTGLGLPTCLRYVEAHGGSMAVRKAPDLGGALVELTLPIGGPPLPRSASISA